MGNRSLQRLAVVVVFVFSVLAVFSQAGMAQMRRHPANGFLEQPYSFNLQSILIKFGKPPYTYKLVLGRLPAGLSMDSSGKITGTPTAVGMPAFSVKVTDSSSPPQQKILPYSISISIGLDSYHGLTGAPIPGCKQTGYFQLVKVKGRWVFADPLCNAFYQWGVYDADRNFILEQILKDRYNNDTSAFANHSLERMTSWGFNAIDGYSSAYMLPVGTWNNPGAKIKIPFVFWFPVLQDVLTSPQNVGLPEPIKDICRGFDSNGFPYYCSNLIDAYDPKWQTANNNELLNQEQIFWGGFNTDPWITAVSLGDSDYVFALKGNDSGSDGAAVYPHAGMLIATVNFRYSGFQDNKIYSKYAWASYLQNKYGNITALNNAWKTGGFYTTFGDAGGFGNGTGVLDEDGRHTSWFGSDLRNRYFDLKGVNRNLVADMDDFLYQFAYQVYGVQASTIKSYDQNHLLACGNYGGIGEGGTRTQVLQALKDAGCNIIVGNWNSYYPKTGLAGNRAQYDTTGLPEYLWYGVSAQLDSDVSQYPDNGAAFADYPNQQQRAQQYAADQQTILGAQGSNGDYYILGTSFWSLTDNSSEETNFGLLSFRDNAYDGKCAVVAQVTDAWGYACGGEAADYGDFTDGVTSTHTHILEQFVKSLVQ